MCSCFKALYTFFEVSFSSVVSNSDSSSSFFVFVLLSMSDSESEGSESSWSFKADSPKSFWVHLTSLVSVIFLVSVLYIRYTSFPFCVPYPTIIARCPLSKILLFIFSPFRIIPTSPNGRKLLAYLGRVS